MILLLGIPSEPSLGLVVEEIQKIGAPHVVVNQRHFAETEMEFQVVGGQVVGWMRYMGKDYSLEQIAAVYTRLMDYRALPELENHPPHSPLWQYCRNLHNTIMCWYEIAPVRVLNRSAEIGSNFSKPYQAQLIMRHGFATPETLVTNDPALVRQFREKHGKIIYKSISCVRSIVQTLSGEDIERLENIRWCPTQFQEYVDGVNVRVHTVGSRRVFATAIRTGATDYRYAYLQGEQEELEAVEISPELEAKCLDLARGLGLGFAGIDLKVTPDGRIYCLEVNPCPAFSYYQLHSGQPIAAAVARYLVEGD